MTRNSRALFTAALIASPLLAIAGSAAHAQSSAQPPRPGEGAPVQPVPPGSDTQSVARGVIRPPERIDPEMQRIPPSGEQSRMPVIPPATTTPRP